MNLLYHPSNGETVITLVKMLTNVDNFYNLAFASKIIASLFWF